MAEANGGGAPARRWFLDACVLYPQLPRGILVGAAEAGLIQLFWSERVLGEWCIAAARSGGMEAEAEARGAQASLVARFPQACVVPEPAVEAAIRLPDRGDAHVAAGASAASATILTFNMRDFPARRLAPHGLEALHPDGALWALFAEDEAALAPAIATALTALARAPADPAAARRALKRAGLPRLGKAWEAAADVREA